MRNHLIAELEKIAEEDHRVVVLTADLGYSVLDSFSRKFPERCMNVGICEQNMAGKTIDTDWTGTIATGSVVLTDVNTAAAAEGTVEAIEAAKRHDCSCLHKIGNQKRFTFL